MLSPQQNRTFRRATNSNPGLTPQNPSPPQGISKTPPISTKRGSVELYFVRNELALVYRFADDY